MVDIQYYKLYNPWSISMQQFCYYTFIL